MSVFPTSPDIEKVKAASLAINCAQAANTYDAGTVSGGAIMVVEAVYYQVVAGATFDSLSIQTNTTTSVEMMSTVEGAVANLTAGKNVKVFTTRTIIPSGSKIQYTLAGTTGTGSGILYLRYQPMTNGAVIA